MKREIKFRGKPFDPSAFGLDFVYGGYYKEPTDERAMFPEDQSLIVTDDLEHIPVIPETVGQFLGIQDKNKIDCYDGDKYINHENGLTGTLKIINSVGGIIVYAEEEKNGNTYNYRPFHEMDLTDFEICGNIHTTPNNN